MKTPDAINGKTPEKIKKGLYECAYKHGTCSICPYKRPSPTNFVTCERELKEEALAYIQQLESTYGQVSKALCGKEDVTPEEVLTAAYQLKSRLAQAERERDAAVSDIPRTCSYYKHFIGYEYIPHCHNTECKKINGIKTGWEWCGVREVNTKEETR